MHVNQPATLTRSAGLRPGEFRGRPEAAPRRRRYGPWQLATAFRSFCSALRPNHPPSRARWFSRGPCGCPSEATPRAARLSGLTKW